MSDQDRSFFPEAYFKTNYFWMRSFAAWTTPSRHWQILTNEAVPAGDGGICLGQAAWRYPEIIVAAKFFGCLSRSRQGIV